MCSDMLVLQALYHGKPIVAMPFFADQLPNADKVVAKVSSTPEALHGSPPALWQGVGTAELGHSEGERQCMLVKAGAPEHIATMCNCLQGCGVQVHPAEAGGPEFSAAINKVLTDSQYTKAAQALSRRLRARKITPVEEAAGTISQGDHHHDCAINLCTCGCSLT